MDYNLEGTDLLENDLEEEFAKRAERNRQKAILLKKSKVVTHPYAKPLVIFSVMFCFLNDCLFCPNFVSKTYKQ